MTEQSNTPLHKPKLNAGGGLAVKIPDSDLQEFIKEVLGEKAKKYSEEEIEKLYKFAIGFSNAFIHLYKKQRLQKLAGLGQK